MDDDHDDIARWAETLSPEGSPGIVSQRMREYLGDQGYEKAVAQNDALSALYLQRQSLTNSLFSLAVVYVVVFGLIGVIAAVALTIKFIF